MSSWHLAPCQVHLYTSKVKECRVCIRAMQETLADLEGMHHSKWTDPRTVTVSSNKREVANRARQRYRQRQKEMKASS